MLMSHHRSNAKKCPSNLTVASQFSTCRICTRVYVNRLAVVRNVVSTPIGLRFEGFRVQIEPVKTSSTADRREV